MRYVHGAVFLLAMLAGSVTVYAGGERAPLEMPAVFGDHMVLQRDACVPVWGTATPGKRVRVELGGERVYTRADDCGEWMARLAPRSAGGPYTLTVKCGKEKIAFEDVLVGDVWVCSGQSNMEFTVSNSDNSKEEIVAANYPEIRLFSVGRKVSGEPLTDCAGSWDACTPETVPGFSAVGYFFGRQLHRDLDVPIGLIKSAWSGTPSEAWTSAETMNAIPEFKPILARWDKIVQDYPQAMETHKAQLEKWEQQAEQAKAEGKEPPRKSRGPLGPGHPHRAGGLYNGMIQPLVPYGIRGAIWYQGESNAGRAYQYRTIFPAMITDWRAKWGYDFPFLFVQLANFNSHRPGQDPATMRERKSKTDDSAWAELREAQSMTLALPNTGQAVIIDVGEAFDIHPRNKQHVGMRLAQSAYRVAYGMDAIDSGPTYRSMRVEGNKIRLQFDHVFSGLMAYEGPPLYEFSVAGEDRKFAWATAVIDGDEIVVSSDEVANPVAVRYGWADNPFCNLYNKDGLPASPFRTDDWPGVTLNNK